MDGLGEDIFGMPLVLPAPPINQPVSLINCNGWQVQVGKDQTLPLMILDNGELSLRNVADLPLFLGNNLEEENVILEQNYPPHVQNAEKQTVMKESLITKNDKEDIEVVKNSSDCDLNVNGNNEISESCLMENLVETVIVYKCKLCAFKSTEKGLLSVHIKNIHLKMNTKNEGPVVLSGENEIRPDSSCSSNDSQKDQLVYMCGSCNEAFAGFGECRVHMAQHHKIMMGSKPSPKSDDSSNKEDEEQVKVKTPERRETDPKKAPEKTINSPCERTIECPMNRCQTKFSTSLGLSRHRACHTASNPKEFICNYCSTSFSKWSMCANHLWRIHEIDVELFSCTECKYKTATRVKMKNHMQIHGKCKDYMCNECGKMFSQQPQLRNHEVTHLRTKLEGDRPRWYTKKECDQCQKIFANSKSLKKHVQAVHRKLRPYVCHVCGHSSASKNMLQIHLRQHTGEKPFSCPSCPFTTGDHNSLRRHRMRHTGVRPYRCPHCPYSSIQNCSLKHHMMTWHQIDKNDIQNRGKRDDKRPAPLKSAADSTSVDMKDHLETELLSTVQTNFLTLGFDLQENQVSVATVDRTYKKNSMQSGIVLSSNQEGSKEMVIKIPMSPERFSYLNGSRMTDEDLNAFE